jgi:hypothetical protein
MKKTLLFTCLLVFTTLVMLAQGHVDTDSTHAETASSGGFDFTALAIGAVVGLIIGYVVGSRSAKK